jgi:hypothetical protein
VPSAERVLAWDLAKDVVIVGQWREHGQPPPAKVPAASFELRRVSTGEVLEQHDCALQPTGPCTPDLLDVAGARWRQRGSSGAGRLRVVESRTAGGGREWALETRAKKNWQRLYWIEVMDRDEAAQERLRFRVTPFDRQAGVVLVGLQMQATGGNCPYTVAQVLRIPESDLADPARPGRQADLLAHPRRDHPFEHWRTTIELGPLPPDRLLEAMRAAENDAKVDFAVRWWRDGIQALEPSRLAPLAAALKKDTGLASTRTRLGL